MADTLDRPATDFRDAAGGAVTVQIDADVAAWMMATAPDLTGEVNNLLRFYMDTSLNKEREFDPDAFEPGELNHPQPPMLDF